MARLLLTGGTGLIGSEFVRHAIEAGHALTLVCRAPVPGPFRVVVADLGEAASLAALLPQERFDAVVYLAQAAQHHAFPANASSCVALNIAAPVALCQWAVQSGCQQFIYASSGGICGPAADRTQRVVETCARRSSMELPYFLATKARCEELLEPFASRIQLDFLRYFFVYGARQRPDFLFPRLADRIRRGEAIDLAQGSGPLINPIHAADAAALTLRAIGTRGEPVTNIAGGEDVALADVVRQLERALGRTANVTPGGGDAPVYLADTGRMKKRLGEPRVTLAEGVAALAASLKEAP